MKAVEIKEAGGRDAVLLENDTFRTVITDNKGMIPELSTKCGNGWLNSHWQPWFRANSGEPWQEEKHSAFWKAPLLYDIAGSFPCIPNFGPGHSAQGYDMPPHGYTAFNTWKRESIQVNNSHTVSVTSLKSPDHPFFYRKWDLIAQNENILYTRLDITNQGTRPEKYNVSWHNTVGTPFLEKGCLIDNNARAFAVLPKGGEFDTTGRLAMGAVADSLEKVPARDGGTVNLREVPGVIGYADFITGALSADTAFGWSTVVNPRQKAVYLAFFPGPADVPSNEIPLYFCDLWMNYGGRFYQPWAAADGLTDHTFCLGTENAVGYYANGLEASVKAGTLLGNPVYLTLNPGETRTLCYGTLFQTYEGPELDDGIMDVVPREKTLLLKGRGGKSLELNGDGAFRLLRQMA